MPGIENLMGGLAMGISQGKAAAQQRAMMEEYRKAQTDMIKLEAKKAEAQLKLQEFQAPIYEAIAKAAQGQGGGLPGPGIPQGPQTLPAQIPGVMGREVAPPPATQPLPEIMAQGQIQIPGNPANNISVRQNNPGNLKFVGQPGAQAGTRGFAIFPTPEAGFAALQNQIEIDKGRNLTLNQFANKYAPPFENDTNSWVKNVASMTGATPDTPIASIPTPSLARAVAKVESSAVIGSGQTQPTQAPGTLPVPTTPGPSPSGITGQKLLEGFLKKNFGVEPDEVKYQKMGSHLWVMDKQGKVMGVYPGQGEYKMTEVKNPDGSVTTVPIMTPPSPLPPGVPVFSMPGGQGQGLGPPSAMFGGGVQTAPPAYSYQEVTEPTGAKKKVAVPQAQPGFAYQSEPAGAKIGDAGRLNMIMQADNRMSEVNNLVFPGGKLDRTLLLKASAPMGGIGEGSQLYSKMYQAVDSALRLETGAQANASEIEVKMREYWPSVKDTEATIKQKMKDLNEYVNGAVKLADPTGEIRKMRGAPPQAGTGKRLRYNPQTGAVEPVQ